MIQDTISELEEKIAKAEAANPEGRAELLRLLATLKSEISLLSRTHGEDAESIAGFARVSTLEAIREKKNPELMKLSRDGLASSVTQFEQSHPGLVHLVNRICETLASLGI